MLNKMEKKILIILNKNITKCAIVCWSGLGFYRGMKSYEYDFGTSEKFNDNPYLYTKKFKNSSIMIFGGFVGLILYIHPFFSFITIPKEIYRLEVNIRGLENEKKTDYYNQLF